MECRHAVALQRAELHLLTLLGGLRDLLTRQPFSAPLSLRSAGSLMKRVGSRGSMVYVSGSILNNHSGHTVLRLLGRCSAGTMPLVSPRSPKENHWKLLAALLIMSHSSILSLIPCMIALVPFPIRQVPPEPASAPLTGAGGLRAGLATAGRVGLTAFVTR